MVDELKYQLEETEQNLGHQLDEEREVNRKLHAEVDNLQQQGKDVVDFLPHRKQSDSPKRPTSDDSDERGKKHSRSSSVSASKKNDQKPKLRRTAARKTGMLRDIILYCDFLLTF